MCLWGSSMGAKGLLQLASSQPPRSSEGIGFWEPWRHWDQNAPDLQRFGKAKGWCSPFAGRRERLSSPLSTPELEPLAPCWSSKGDTLCSQLISPAAADTGMRHTRVGRCGPLISPDRQADNQKRLRVSLTSPNRLLPGREEPAKQAQAGGGFPPGV